MALVRARNMTRPGWIIASGGSGGSGITYNHRTYSFGGTAEGSIIPEKRFNKNCPCGYNNKFNDEDTCAYCGEKLIGEYTYEQEYTTQQLYTLGSGTPISTVTAAQPVGYPYIATQNAVYGIDPWEPNLYADCTIQVSTDTFGRETRKWVDSKDGRVRKIEISHYGTLLYKEEYP